MSPSAGVAKISSCRHMAASFTNRDTRRYWMSSSEELPTGRDVQAEKSRRGGLQEPHRDESWPPTLEKVLSGGQCGAGVRCFGQV